MRSSDEDGGLEGRWKESKVEVFEDFEVFGKVRIEDVGIV